ncbi:dihydrofolate reductase-like domain-containing protein [Kockovaella imperatae]|uniref:Dihydrofolate reductase n=1 Tax=Kockovaella imperatae TaxID=4999 RepID=A0A1Y1U935_9TREE|nr:dihydrofolate reductase-like domain-containing protein [Kockovaella imperatae]ORX34016.1 dihydrofolate reductase-like domain-containing protein [Kockovaella imperatae]
MPSDHTTTMPISRSMTAIVAATTSNGIGKNGTLAWRLPGEMKYFARVTTGESPTTPNAVIMGRKTWESIPAKFRPLKDRHNIVVSRQELDLPGESTSSATSLESALTQTRGAHRIFLMGGAQLYNEALNQSSTSTQSPLVDRVLLTRIISPEYASDVFLNDFASTQVDGRPIWLRSTHEELCKWLGWEAPKGEIEEKGTTYRFEMWVRR